MGLDSVCSLIRTLYDNPYIAQACGIDSPAQIPSQPTFSRFFAKLCRKQYALAVKDMMRNMVRRMFKEYPGFGKSVAIDSTDIKAWSNGGKRREGKTSDPEAGWVIKKNTDGNREYVWGYKVHLIADTQYEMPLGMIVTKGNTPDVKRASNLLSEVRFTPCCR